MNYKNMVKFLLSVFVSINLFSNISYAEDFNINIDIENVNEGVWVKNSTDLIITSSDISQITYITVVEGDREYTLEEILKGKGKDITQNVINKGDYFILTVENNSYLTIYIRDRLDRENIKGYKVNNVDNQKPKLYVTPSSTEWRLEDSEITLSIYAEDNESGISEIIMPDGTSTKNPVSNYVIGSNAKYQFIVRDNVGLETIFTYEEGKIDRTDPIVNITSSTTEFVNDKVELDISSIDEESGIKYIVLPDGNMIYSSNFKYVVYENGTYTFKAVNNVGKATDKVFEVSNIDKEGSSVEVNVSYDTEWTTEKRISISAIDDISGIAGIKTPDGDYINTSFYDYKALKEGVYEFVIYDNAKNETPIEIIVNNIDTKYPIIDLQLDKDNNVILINATDNESGISEIILPNNKKILKEFITENMEFNYSSPGTYSFKVIDVAGNESIRTINID